MTKQEALPIRFFLGLAALAALVAQFVIIPVVAAGNASAYPDIAYLAFPTAMVLVAAIAGVEMTLVAAWQLVSSAVAGRAWTRWSTRWANTMTGSLIFTAVLLAGVCVYVGFIAGVGGPVMLFGLLVSLAVVPVALALSHWMRDWLGDGDVDDRIAVGRASSPISRHA